MQDLSPDPVIPEVRLKAERFIRLNCVKPVLILKLVGLDLIGQSDPSAFLTHVKDHARTFLVDHFHGRNELFLTITTKRAQNLPCKTFRVNAHQSRLFTDLSMDQRHMLDAVYKENYAGRAEVLQVFKISKVGQIAGGGVRRRVVRSGAQAFQTAMSPTLMSLLASTGPIFCGR